MTRFTITVPCKSYVKAFLESNCGSPVDLVHLPEVQGVFRLCLRTKPRHHESKAIGNYSAKVEISIPEDDFYRLGWEMNKENVVEFNKKVERQAKFFMRQYVIVNHAFRIPVATCIREFQDKYGFHEQIWSYEAIKKDFDRHAENTDLRSLREIRAEINKILLENLSDLGTISQKFKKEMSYE